MHKKVFEHKKDLRERLSVLQHHYHTNFFPFVAQQLFHHTVCSPTSTDTFANMAALIDQVVAAQQLVIEWVTEQKKGHSKAAGLWAMTVQSYEEISARKIRHTYCNVK